MASRLVSPAQCWPRARSVRPVQAIHRPASSPPALREGGQEGGDPAGGGCRLRLGVVGHAALHRPHCLLAGPRRPHAPQARRKVHCCCCHGPERQGAPAGWTKNQCNSECGRSGWLERSKVALGVWESWWREALDSPCECSTCAREWLPLLVFKQVFLTDQLS